MPWPLITKAQLEARLSKRVVQRLLDDDRDGAADTNVVDRLLLDASGKFAGFAAQIYDIAAIRAMAANVLPDEVTRLTLDVAQAMAAQRHPEFVRLDGFELMKQVVAELKMLREGMTNTGVADDVAPETQDIGGAVVSGSPREDLFI